ncbi:unnamed protein product [Spirodela intermedia]|uniref:Uncharacterized protein n=1 Tax=Spirodela intermedia TaxID=51605 RepID=A0A7I8JU93_SPIIN|nr:unnamed protein product [Spirodela intermedia]CAA6673777.1 unnamed protein product [Spirodela intermedia]
MASILKNNRSARLSSSSSVSFLRRSSSGRLNSGEFQGYHVHIPPTPDNQPMAGCEVPVDASIAARVEEQYVSSSIFTGGFNSVTRAHILDKVTDTAASHPQMAGGAGGSSSCAVAGCDGKVLRDERGREILPCACDFKICADCFSDAVREGGIGGAVCPGCKEPYRTADIEEAAAAGDRAALPLPPPPGGVSKMERRLSLMKSGKFSRSQTGTSTTTDGCTRPRAPTATATPSGPRRTARRRRQPTELAAKPWRPLTRKLKIPAAILSPYRVLVFLRMIALGLFLAWRIRHKNEDAIWLWGMSVVCEVWFAFCWLLDQLPKLSPINRATDLAVLKEKFESGGGGGKSDLPGIDIFVSTADPEKEPPLKLACYVSDDGGALLTFEAMAEAASFSHIWVPFCRKHEIEPRNPESYFNLRKDPYKNKLRPDFVRDRRRVKREYDEFKVRINGLPDSIRRRSDAYHAREEIKAMKLRRRTPAAAAAAGEALKIPKATWMADGTHWPGTWTVPSPEHARGDHAGIIQRPATAGGILDLAEVDIRLPMLVYVSREKRPGYDHNKKAGAMNALVRASAVMSNGPFILNLDCDHYVYNSQALREGICFMMDRGGDRLCYVQFPQRFEGIDPSDRYANHNSVFFDVNMRALDGLQGPVYVGTGCLFRRLALYGFDPPNLQAPPPHQTQAALLQTACNEDDEDEEKKMINPSTAATFRKQFGNSDVLVESIPVAENGRRPGALTIARDLLDAAAVAEAIAVISCWYEDKTEWGRRLGWIYGSVTEDVVTGYRMHNRGWRSVYCVSATKRDAFRGTAPINLTDRLHQVLRWATGSVEIFFSGNNALLASSRMKLLQRVAYLNFIVQSLNVTFLAYLLAITVTMCMLAALEIKWSGIGLEEWWRNEQFWLIGGTSAHLAAVLQGLLKVVAGIEISFTLTSKSAGGGDGDDDEFADLYALKWSSLMIPPLTIIMVNVVAIAVGISRTIYSVLPQWSRLLGGVFFSFWVLAHLYPFAKGLMGRRGRTPTVVFVWSGLIAITISLLWVAINPPSSSSQIGGSFTFP